MVFSNLESEEEQIKCQLTKDNIKKAKSDFVNKAFYVFGFNMKFCEGIKNFAAMKSHFSFFFPSNNKASKISIFDFQELSKFEILLQNWVKLKYCFLILNVFLIKKGPPALLSKIVTNRAHRKTNIKNISKKYILWYKTVLPPTRNAWDWFIY